MADGLHEIFHRRILTWISRLARSEVSFYSTHAGLLLAIPLALIRFRPFAVGRGGKHSGMRAGLGVSDFRPSLVLDWISTIKMSLAFQ